MSKLKLISSNEDPIDIDRPVLLDPKGEYELMYVRHTTSRFFGSSLKLTITFQIHTLGENYCRHISKFYNIAGKDKKNRIKPTGWHSDYVRDYTQLFDRPRRLADVPVSMFKGKILRATVRTVSKDSKQNKLQDVLKYSVVDKLIEVSAGG